MGKLFVGLIFTMMGGIRLMVGRAGIDLMPAFVGYIFMVRAFVELEQVDSFRRSRAVGWLAAAVSAVVWVLDLTGTEFPVLTLGSRMLGVYLTWMVAVGVGELEDWLEGNLNGGRLKLIWIAQLLVLLYTAMTAEVDSGPFSVGRFLQLAVTLLYLMFFYQSWMLCRKLLRDRGEQFPARKGQTSVSLHQITINGPEDWPYESTLWVVISAALRAEGVEVPCAVEVTITDDAGIREVNRDTRGIDAPTDVLSFPGFQLEAGEKPLPQWADPDSGLVWLGEMLISLERVREQALEFGHSIERELCYLAVHSVLHLLGYDHVDEGPMKARMREREEAILEELDITRDGEGQQPADPV